MTEPKTLVETRLDGNLMESSELLSEGPVLAPLGGQAVRVDEAATLAVWLEIGV